MPDFSVLGARGWGGVEEKPAREPGCFRDLNLDLIVEGVVAGLDEYGLREFFYSPLSDADEIAYRQEVASELEEGPALAAVKAFCLGMRAAREREAQVSRLAHEAQRDRWFLDAASAYCEAVLGLATALKALSPRSRGLASLVEYLSGYVESPAFDSLVEEARALLWALGRIRYSLSIRRGELRVGRESGGEDCARAVERLFSPLAEGAKDYPAQFSDPRDLNPVETAVLDAVARLFADEFSALSAFRERHRGYADPVILAFDREIQFYVAYLDYIAPAKALGLDFCYPRLSGSREVESRSSFDLALARKLADSGAKAVVNDFFLSGEERILVVTGPNQGGKSTFARGFGQLHYLARLGLPVPGTEAKLLLCDAIFTHFEKEEGREDRRGRLKDELERLKYLLERATPRSVVVLNEILSCTSRRDAVFIGERILRGILDLGAIGVCVTFIDELASLGGGAVSMVCGIEAVDHDGRTYRIERRPPDGLAYALTIARRRGLDRPDILARFAR